MLPRIPPIGSYALTVSSQKGMTNPAPGTYIYPKGTSVEITATPAPGWKFDHWSGDVSEQQKYQATITIIMNSPKSITAHFAEIPLVYYSLTINTDGQGTTTPSPGSYSYVEGRIINITAIPNSGWKFDCWSGATIGSKNPIAIIVNSNKTVTANFITGLYLNY